ncbi:MAG TPA: hypothetical protein VNH22_03190 [Blastocatellia bacterium]|jgi:hypothetical protein|nr:hypothetical protein [Blastocatellia bacterium]
MSALISDIHSFRAGQTVRTDFGEGVVSAVSYIDSIIYVSLSKEPSALYIFRPEQVEALAS